MKDVVSAERSQFIPVLLEVNRNLGAELCLELGGAAVRFCGFTGPAPGWAPAFLISAVMPFRNVVTLTWVICR